MTRYRLPESLALSHVRRPSVLLIAATLAASLGACGGDPKAPTELVAPTAPSIAAVTVTASTPTISVGQSTELVASAATAGGEAMSAVTLTWQSETPAVATVDATGRVTAVSPGTAVIAARAGTVRGTATITVQPGPAAPIANLNKIVDSVRLAWKHPAMGAAIVTLDEGIVAIGAAGTRRVTGGAAVTTNDLWNLASNTKAMTALLAAVAVSQNRIQWTTTVAQAFPEIASIRPEYRDVALRELLSHQSGLTPGVSSGSGGPVPGTPAAAQRAALVPLALQQAPPAAMKRGTFAYNNVGYIVAAAMVERALGTTFEEAMTRHVFAPLGMTDVGWGPQAAAGSTTQPVAHLRQSDGSWSVLEGHDNPPFFNGAGGTHMSLASWGRFVREVLRAEAGTSTIAPASVARQTTTSVVDVGPGRTYAMGWGLTTAGWAGGKVLDHSGSNLANHSLAVLAPQRKVAFLLTTNGNDATQPSGSLPALLALHGRLLTFYNTGK